MLPLLVITGFLGTGKTSLLRELLPQLEESGITPHVILNDTKTRASMLRLCKPPEC